MPYIEVFKDRLSSWLCVQTLDYFVGFLLKFHISYLIIIIMTFVTWTIWFTYIFDGKYITSFNFVGSPSLAFIQILYLPNRSWLLFFFLELRTAFWNGIFCTTFNHPNNNKIQMTVCIKKIPKERLHCTITSQATDHNYNNYVEYSLLWGWNIQSRQDTLLRKRNGRPRDYWTFC